MSDDVFRIVVAVGVVLAALSFVVQAIVGIATLGAAKKMQQKVAAMADRAEPVVDKIGPMVDRFLPILDKVVPVLDKAGLAVDKLRPSLDKLGPSLEKVGPIIERVGYMVEKFGPVADKASELLSKNPQPDETQIRAAMNGHLCRCGTYPRVIKAIQRASTAMHSGKGANA